MSTYSKIKMRYIMEGFVELTKFEVIKQISKIMLESEKIEIFKA